MQVLADLGGHAQVLDQRRRVASGQLEAGRRLDGLAGHGVPRHGFPPDRNSAPRQRIAQSGRRI